MKKWLLITMGLVLLSGCATFKNWMATQDAAKLAEELKLIEQLLNQNQIGRQLDVPLDLGKELSKVGLRGSLPKSDSSVLSGNPR